MRQLYYIETIYGEPLYTYLETHLNKSVVLNHILLYHQHTWAPPELLELIDGEVEPYWTWALNDIIVRAPWCKAKQRCLLLSQLTPQIISRQRVQLMLKIEINNTVSEVVVKAGKASVYPPLLFSNSTQIGMTLTEKFPNRRHELDV